MAKYQLKPKCLFVDAKVYDDNGMPIKNAKIDADLVGPHVMDTSTSPAAYLLLNDAAAFIARFIVLGVDTDFIPQLLVSEYAPAVVDKPNDQVADVVAMLFPKFMKDRTYPRAYDTPKKGMEGNHAGKYPLDFKVNFFGVGAVKGPI
jgi:hypothetical protein